MDVIKLEFSGYFISKDQLPQISGIYTVYRGIYNKLADTVSLKEMLYIGESADIWGRVTSHNKEDAWKRRLKDGEILIFSYAPITIGRERAEAALIFKHKPPLNTLCVDNFAFKSLKVDVSGKAKFLLSSFSVFDTRVTA